CLTIVRRLILEVRLQKMRPHYDFTLTMSAVVGLLAFGWHVAQLQRPTKALRVSTVQANVPRAEKFDRQFANKIFEQFNRLSQIAMQSNPPPDLLVWPESSMPGPIQEGDESYRFVMDFAAANKTDLLLGAVDFE